MPLHVPVPQLPPRGAYARRRSRSALCGSLALTRAEPITAFCPVCTPTVGPPFACTRSHTPSRPPVVRCSDPRFRAGCCRRGPGQGSRTGQRVGATNGEWGEGQREGMDDREGSSGRRRKGQSETEGAVGDGRGSRDGGDRQEGRHAGPRCGDPVAGSANDSRTSRLAPSPPDPSPRPPGDPAAHARRRRQRLTVTIRADGSRVPIVASTSPSSIPSSPPTAGLANRDHEGVPRQHAQLRPSRHRRREQLPCPLSIRAGHLATTGQFRWPCPGRTIVRRAGRARWSLELRMFPAEHRRPSGSRMPLATSHSRFVTSCVSLRQSSGSAPTRSPLSSGTFGALGRDRDGGLDGSPSPRPSPSLPVLARPSNPSLEAFHVERTRHPVIHCS